jgi:hypothetical protein
MKGWKMRYFIIALLLSFASPGMTLTPNDLRGAEIIDRDNCRDRESGDHGFCFIVQHDGIYLIFHDQEGARFIRRMRDDGTGYDTIWHRDGTAPPPGISL